MNAIQANSQFQTTSLHGTGTLPLAPFSNVAKCLRSQDQPSEDPRYGWVVVAAAAICMAFGNGPLLTISVFLSPLTAEFGWQRGDISFAYLVGTMALGLGGIAMGWLADRFPVRRLVLVGAGAIGSSFLLLGRIETLWQLYLLYGLLGGVGGAVCFSPLIALTGKWFVRRKGLALGITTAGTSLGFAIIPFLARYLISTQGWRDSYTLLAVLCAGTVAVSALLLRDPPDLAQDRQVGAASSPDHEGTENPFSFAVTVAWLSAAALFSMTLIGTATVHMVALTQDKGIEPQLAASVLSIIMVGCIAGRVGFGRLADTIGGLKAVLIAALGETVIVYGFVQVHELFPLYLLGALFGVSYGGVMTCYMICLREIVPMRHLGMSVGILSLLGWAGIGLGGWQGGILFDLSGDYSVSFAVALFAGIVNIAVLGALWLRLHRRSEILGTEASVPSARYWRGWLSEGTSLIRKGTTILRAPIANRA